MFGDSPLLFSFFGRAKPQKAAWQREGMRVHCISSTASGSRAKIYAKRGGGQEKRRGGVHIASLAVVPGIKLTSIALSSLAVQRNKPLMSWSFACLMVINALAAGHGQKPPVAAILLHTCTWTNPWLHGVGEFLWNSSDQMWMLMLAAHCTNSPAYFNEGDDG